MFALIVIFSIATLISGMCLWMGMKITNVDGTLPAMLGVAAASTALSFIPLIGGIIGLVAMFALICALTDANFWPDAVLMVLVAKGIGFATNMFLLDLLGA